MSEQNSKLETGKNINNKKYHQCPSSYDDSLSESSAYPTLVLQHPPVIQQPVSAINGQNVQFGPYPVNVICHHCRSFIVTRTESEPSMTAWVLSFAMCIIFWPLSCVPCLLGSLRDVTHDCPKCNKVLGVYKRGVSK